MWGDLTDDELDTIAGKRDDLIGRLQTKYGINKQKAQEQADSGIQSYSHSPYAR